MQDLATLANDAGRPAFASTPDPADLIPLRAAARLIPSRRAGRPCNVATLWRWATVGTRGVKLCTWRLGSTLCTTTSAIREFIAAMSAADPICSSAAPRPVAAVAPPPRPAEAVTVLRQAGILPAGTGVRSKRVGRQS